VLGSCLQITASLQWRSQLIEVKTLRQWVTQIAIEVRPAVLEHRQVLANLSKIVEVDSGKAEAFPLRAVGYHCSPGVHHHAVAITCSCLMVASTLCWCHHIALGFNGTGPQQHLRMRCVFTPVYVLSTGEVTGNRHYNPCDHSDNCLGK
jgi:hypothetical protein